jgi:hypothetical protein
MATALETAFISWKMSLEEIKAARVLHPEQRMYYQSLQSDAAHQKMALVLDPYKPLLFVQQDAYLRGQIELLAMLLDGTDEKISLPAGAVTQTQSSNSTGE